MNIMTYKLDNFIADVTKAVELNRFWDCEFFLKRFSDSPALHDHLNAELENLINDPFKNAPKLMSNGIVLHSTPEWSLLQSFYEHSPAHLYTIPFDGLISPAARNSIVYTVYELPSTYVNSVFDRTCALTVSGTFEAKPGEIIRMDSSKYLYDIHTPSPVAALRLYTATSQELQWAFDRKSLLPVQAISSTENASGLTLTMQVLSMLKDHRAIRSIQAIADQHSQHFVRWEAVKAIAKIDPLVGLAAITKATKDIHPHVVNAANLTLAHHQRLRDKTSSMETGA